MIIQNTGFFEYPIPNTEYPMLNLKPLDIEHWAFIIQNSVSEYPISNTEYRMLNGNHWILGIGYSIFRIQFSF